MSQTVKPKQVPRGCSHEGSRRLSSGWARGSPKVCICLIIGNFNRKRLMNVLWRLTTLLFLLPEVSWVPVKVGDGLTGNRCLKGGTPENTFQEGPLFCLILQLSLPGVTVILGIPRFNTTTMSPSSLLRTQYLIYREPENLAAKGP